jgi:hypothetical protein
MKNLHTILPFYDSLSEQFRYRSDLMVDRKRYRLTVGTARVLPFIIRKLTDGGTTANLTFDIIDASTGSIISSPDATTYLSITTGTVYDYIKYVAALDFAEALPIGSELYIRIKDTKPDPDKYWYSETFMVVASLANYTLLEWSDDNTLAGVLGSFQQKMYVDNIFKHNEYIRKDEGEEKDEILVKEKQSVAYVDNLFIHTAPKYLIDALALLPLMDNVQVTDIFGDCYVPLEIKVKDPDWIADTGGAEAKLQIVLTREIVIKKLTYKEVACICNSGGSDALIDAGKSTLSAGVPLTVNFTETFTGVNYSLELRGYTSDGDPVFPYVSAEATTYFIVETLVDCTIEWTAIEK